MNHAPRTSRRTLLQGTAAAILGPAAAAAFGSEPAEAGAVRRRANGYPTNLFGSTPDDYARVGLSPTSYHQWEDGFRTAAVNTDPDAYEWWYAEFTGDDGTVVCLTLQTRPGNGFEPDTTEADRRPGVSLVVTDPDGTNHHLSKTYTWDDFTARTDHCDVRVGPFTCTGNLDTYRIQGTDGHLAIDLTLTSLVRPFRPGTGFRFLNGTSKYHAWFAAVPAGNAKGTVTVHGRRRRFTGRGHHDHKWGNISFAHFVDHWRWGRGRVDQYAVVGVDFHLRPEFGATYQPILLVDDTSTGKRLISSVDPQAIRATESEPRPHPDPDYPRHYYATVDWRYTNGTGNSRVTMTDTEKVLEARHYLTDPSPAQQATLAQLGIDQVWHTRYDATLSFNSAAASRIAAVASVCTLENVQFSMDSSPP
ncbi:hypothetical protein ODJ79_39980 [Actinoplanes sp. KI2]|uniref:hypothetical protein n=1 Tax=Actinoplanes sp. KI2 TaxID=2983315 RepID=UPI0021D5F6E3|nr:hypothetical protein [Actinoplanes sp. KI2]MCU7729933.1 hypothetical protein [Actinoplanes sp. KI2]